MRPYQSSGSILFVYDVVHHPFVVGGGFESAWSIKGGADQGGYFSPTSEKEAIVLVKRFATIKKFKQSSEELQKTFINRISHFRKSKNNLGKCRRYSRF
jgi:hypothetical protein